MAKLFNLFDRAVQTLARPKVEAPDRAPASANPTAMRWPMPLPAPVTKAIFPSRLNRFMIPERGFGKTFGKVSQFMRWLVP